MKFPSLYPKITELRASLGGRPRYITSLDSATVALRALAKCLQGKDLRSEGIAPAAAALGIDAINHLPNQVLENLAPWSGWMSASSPSVLDEVDSETISRWVVNQYPKRRYPAVMIGSANGAAVNLGAALGIPWLPQTLLITLRRSGDPDEPKQDMEWAKAPAQRLLARNPDLPTPGRRKVRPRAWLSHSSDCFQPSTGLESTGR